MIAKNLFRQSLRSFHSTARIQVVHPVSGLPAFNAAINSDKLTVIDFYATWCGPCHAVAPLVEKFSDEFSDAHFIKIDVDESQDVAQEVGIRAMPTFQLYKAGIKVGEIVGANPPAIKAAIQKNL
ncbi:uncharacterized protein SAPINGB_P004263 [Magnusiomyces paraingens]|uniref:Thioredoxin domain-containing protein n=1 Tax=Magnusiomyces paraingens TaxID=2606893 RepID=A0A5E8BVY2_9ASCO|nr:uncharacterized protein SAPINGB_P004263 [Saprochaete ingens]VVT54789.1 unnamed protein product [Saprochaete ingens]